MSAEGGQTDLPASAGEADENDIYTGADLERALT